MVSAKNIYDFIDTIAPFKTAESWDNSGLLIGSNTQMISRALVALDITNEVIDEAVSLRAQMIISHHPVIFEPLKRIGSNSIPYNLVKNMLAVICAHTNLDVAKNGVNDALAEHLGFIKTEPLEIMSENTSLGRIGTLDEEYSPERFADYVKKCLGCQGLRYVSGGKPIKTVAMCGGAGGDLLHTVIEKEIDCFVTADIKHNVFCDAKRKHLTLIDAGHFYTENVVVENLTKMLAARFLTVTFTASKNSCAPEIYL